MYLLRSENLTGLGTAMGTERIRNNWVKYFTTADAAAKFAAKDYATSRGLPMQELLIWHPTDSDCWRSDDLGFVMYRIEKVKIEVDS